MTYKLFLVNCWPGRFFEETRWLLFFGHRPKCFWNDRRKRL